MPSMLALCYPQLFLIFMYLMEMTTPRDISILMLLTAFAASVFTDSLAYFTGRAMGRRKLCPEISPKKTVEGAAGGLVGGAADFSGGAYFRFGSIQSADIHTSGNCSERFFSMGICRLP